MNWGEYLCSTVAHRRKRHWDLLLLRDNNYLTWTPAGLTGLEPDYLAAKQICQTYLPSEYKSHKIQGCGKKCLVSKIMSLVSRFKGLSQSLSNVLTWHVKRRKCQEKVLLNYWKTLDTTNAPAETVNPHDPLLLIQYLEVFVQYIASKISIRGHVQESHDGLHLRSKRRGSWFSRPYLSII